MEKLDSTSSRMETGARKNVVYDSWISWLLSTDEQPTASTLRKQEERVDDILDDVLLVLG